MATPDDPSAAAQHRLHSLHGTSQPYAAAPPPTSGLPPSLGASPVSVGFGGLAAGPDQPQAHLQRGSTSGPGLLDGGRVGSISIDAGAGGPGPSQPRQPGAEGVVPARIRRRMRMITSCLECRRRKLKCNKSEPCTNCLKFSRECVYLSPKLDEASQLRLTEIKEKVGSLERQLERDVAKSTTRGLSQQRILADDVEDDFDEERDLEITPMVALDLMYEDDADGADDIIDLGIQIGKMRITERIGGLNRPRLAEEIQTGLSGARSPASPAGDVGSGPNAGRPPPFARAFSESGGSDVSIPDFLRPGATYIPPTSGFFFGQVVQSPSIVNFLLAKDSGDRLMHRYFQAVHPIARCMHRPSFELQYASFWEEIRRCYEPRASIQAIVFAAWFSAAVSLDELTAPQEYGFTKASLVENMKIGAEAALSKANFLRTTRVETMQAFVMYLIPLCRAEVSRAHSVLVGAAVRMAECMGLHRDGEAYGLNPLETHVRRLLWHQLCFLDIRTCEAQGPKPAIRREDYDTRLPINCEEDELTLAVEPPQPAEHWTSTLLPLVRFEINEMMRIIWVDRRKLENRKMTLSSVLTKIESFRRRMLEKYDHYLDDRMPIQRYTKLVMHLLMYRLHAMVLHPYHSNTTNAMPQRLNSILIMSGIMIIEIAIQLETDPMFKQWAWYIGAYQQFQIALLLATEMYYRPNHREADRIWKCLDYVFDMEHDMSREEKGMRILMEIGGKTAIYTNMRKMRAPTGIAKAVPGKQAVRSDRPPEGPPVSHFTPPAMPQLQQRPGSAAQLPKAFSPGHMQQSPMGSGGHGHQAGSEPMSVVPNGLPAMTMPMQPSQPPMTAPAFAGPPPNMVFGGVTNGEVLWGPPPLPPNPDSPENSSDGGSVAGHLQHGGMAGAASAGIMENIDWDAFNALFPSDPQTGEINFSGFVDPTLGLKWHS